MSTEYVSWFAIPAALAGVALFAAAAAAQQQFSELPKYVLPTDSDNTFAVALGDVDSDGDPDLVCGNVGSGRNRLYLNDGTGIFTDATVARMPPDSEDGTSAVALADVDSDGDLDLVLGNDYRDQNRLYLNDSTGTFTDVTAARLPMDSDDTLAVAIGDVDGDGDLDLIFANQSRHQNRLYLNDGTATFTNATAARLPSDNDQTHAVVLGDVDGDGDADLVFGNLEQNRLYLNDGTGTFTDVTATRMPPDGDRTHALALEDVDGDGAPDLVCGNGYPSYQNRLYLNDGTGRFTDVTAARMPIDRDETLAVALADVDSDSDADLVFGNLNEQNRLYLNNGSGTFSDTTMMRMPTGITETCAVALSDVDADGDPDLVCGNASSAGRNWLYLNLLRQLDVPLPVALGQLYQLDVYARYGLTGTVDTTVPFISTGTASIPVPPLGTFALDPAQMIRLPAFIIQQPEGMSSTSFVVPNIPGLVGASVYAQAVIVQYPVEHRLTNWTSDVIMQ